MACHFKPIGGPLVSFFSDGPKDDSGKATLITNYTETIFADLRLIATIASRLKFFIEPPRSSPPALAKHRQAQCKAWSANMDS